MKSRFRILVSCVAAVVIASYAYAQMPELKPGQWSITITMTMSEISDENQDDLTAELFAQLLQELSQPNHYQTCITMDDIAALNFGAYEEDDSCTETSRSIDGNVIMLAHECSDSTDQMRVEIESPEKLKVTVDSVSDDGAARISVAGQWVGAICTED